MGVESRRKRLPAVAWAALLALISAACAASCAPLDEPGAAKSTRAVLDPQAASIPVEGYVLGAELELDEPVLGVGRAEAKTPVIASGPAGISLVVWSVNGWIFGARIDAAARLLDETPIRISSGGYPAVAFDGTTWLVAWGSAGSIQAKRIDTSGTVLDAVPITVATGPATVDMPSLSRGGDAWLVIWRSYVGTSWDVYASRVDRNGNVLDPSGIRVTNVTNAYDPASVSYDGTRWLVVWAGHGADSGIYGTRVDAEGAVLDPNGIPIATGPVNRFAPIASHHGGAWLVTWQQGSAAGTSVLEGARMSAAGAVLDAPPIAITTAVAGFGSGVSHAATDWLVAWRPA